MVFGARRHLAVLPEVDAEIREWPVPFHDGIPRLLAERGRRSVMLVSGDPFWFGAGSVLAKYLEGSEWTAYPGPSTFSLAAARLAWPLESTRCLGLHAVPLTRIRPFLQRGQRLLVLVRDGEAVIELGHQIREWGFGATVMHILESLEGPNERIRRLSAGQTLPDNVQYPVALGLEVEGQGPAIPRTPGLPDDFFEHDGQLTKQSVRALTLSALAPQAGERLWDIGVGSGSVAIEWLLAHESNRAVGFEKSAERISRAARNARSMGVDWLELVNGEAPEVLENQPSPDAVFIGGGLSQTLLEALWERLPKGVRVIANAVTLESESVLIQWHQARGGELVRLALSSAGSIGPRRGWKAQYPIVQWRVTT